MHSLRPSLCKQAGQLGTNCLLQKKSPWKKSRRRRSVWGCISERNGDSSKPHETYWSLDFFFQQSTFFCTAQGQWEKSNRFTAPDNDRHDRGYKRKSRAYTLLFRDGMNTHTAFQIQGHKHRPEMWRGLRGSCKQEKVHWNFYLISAGARGGVHWDFETLFFGGNQSLLRNGLHTRVVLTRTWWRHTHCYGLHHV